MAVSGHHTATLPKRVVNGIATAMETAATETKLLLKSRQRTFEALLFMSAQSAKRTICMKCLDVR